MSEFDLIATYFTWDESSCDSIENPNESSNENTLANSSLNGSLNQSKKSQNKQSISKQRSSQIIKSVGDDAAVLSLGTNQHLVTSIDTLVSGVHFPIDTSAFDIGYKSLAVNLSDLAAMGAKPEWFTLALTLPEINHDWLSEFSRGLKSLANKAGIALVGGDTTSGPLAISIQVMGSVDAGKALFRNGAREGDKIYVTGTLGDGAVGLLSIQNSLKPNHEMSEDHISYCEQRLNRPTARLNESAVIKEFASACIDVSDGLLQDLSHILKQSNLACTDNVLGAKLELSQIPLSSSLKNINKSDAINYALAGGDDYELLFTIPESLDADFTALINTTDYEISCIGTITNEKGIMDGNNNPLNRTGFNHFS